jgi:small basic protein
MVLGVSIGTYFTLKNIKEYQTPLSYGMIAALGGSFLTATSMYFFDWTVYLFAAKPFPSFIIFFYILEALIIGLIIGIIEGLYFKMRQPIKTIHNHGVDDAFYESLKSK